MTDNTLTNRLRSRPCPRPFLCGEIRRRAGDGLVHDRSHRLQDQNLACGSIDIASCACLVGGRDKGRAARARCALGISSCESCGCAGIEC